MKRVSVFRAINVMRFVCCAALALLLGATLAIPARADVVYTNFGASFCAGDPSCIAFNGINGNVDLLSGPTAPQGFMSSEVIGNNFASGGNFTLDGITLPLDHTDGTSDVYLVADNGGVPGTLPGTALESWLGVTGAPFALGPPPTITLTSVLHPMLTTGSIYWLVVGPSNDASSAGWNYTWDPVASTASNNTNTSLNNWTIEANSVNAFQINGTPTIPNQQVPEPATLPLLGAGLIGLVAISRGGIKS